MLFSVAGEKDCILLIIHIFVTVVICDNVKYKYSSNYYQTNLMYICVGYAVVLVSTYLKFIYYNQLNLLNYFNFNVIFMTIYIYTSSFYIYKK